MNCLLQRVSYARVDVANVTVGQIESGLLVFAGIEKHDDVDVARRMAKKIVGYRIFADANNKMNLNVQDSQGDILLVSQFTLAADTDKGNRPSFSSAAVPELGKSLFASLSAEIESLYKLPQMGQFGADMQVSLCNDGPVSFVLHI